MIQLARDGRGARPLGVTIAGWGLIAEAVFSSVVVGLVTVLADVDPAVKVVGFVAVAAVAALEMWIGRGLLHRRRWLFGIGFPAFFLAVGVLIPPFPGEPPPPTYSVILSGIAMTLWVFVIVALIWYRPWFASSDEPIEVRLQRVSGE